MDEERFIKNKSTDNVDKLDKKVKKAVENRMDDSFVKNRKYRRSILKNIGILRIKSKLSFNKQAELVRENIKKGKKLHAENLDRSEKKIYEQLSAKETNIIEMLKDLKYSKKEIDLYMEDWYELVIGKKERLEIKDVNRKNKKSRSYQKRLRKSKING